MSERDSRSLCEQLTINTWQRLDRAAQLYSLKTPKLNVRCDLRGAAAGQLRRYNDGRLVIRYNLGMAELQPDAFLQQTVPHEVAHLVVWLLHGRKARAHGQEWQAVMHDFGVSADRCHEFEVANNTRRQRRWKYACGCRTHQLSTTRHNRVRRGHEYQCRYCGQLLHRVES